MNVVLIAAAIVLVVVAVLTVLITLAASHASAKYRRKDALDIFYEWFRRAGRRRRR